VDDPLVVDLALGDVLRAVLDAGVVVRVAAEGEAQVEVAGRRRWRPGVAALGWLITLAVLVPSIWALNLSAGWVKQTLAGFQTPDPAAVIPTLLALAAVFAVAVVLTGFSSALRGALWSVQELR